MAAQFRPLTLSNSCQKIVVKAFGASMERVVMRLAHPAQRGFVRGCRILANVLES